MLRGCVNEKTSQKARTIGCTLKHKQKIKSVRLGDMNLINTGEYRRKKINMYQLMSNPELLSKPTIVVSEEKPCFLPWKVLCF